MCWNNGKRSWWISQKIKRKRIYLYRIFAKALRQIPTIICNNVGYNSNEIISKFKKEINDGSTTAGIVRNKGVVGEKKELGVYDCLKLKELVLMNASEAA